jgi:hypothetical protein
MRLLMGFLLLTVSASGSVIVSGGTVHFHFNSPTAIGGDEFSLQFSDGFFLSGTGYHDPHNAPKAPV